MQYCRWIFTLLFYVLSSKQSQIIQLTDINMSSQWWLVWVFITQVTEVFPGLQCMIFEFISSPLPPLSNPSIGSCVSNTVHVSLPASHNDWCCFTTGVGFKQSWMHVIYSDARSDGGARNQHNNGRAKAFDNNTEVWAWGEAVFTYFQCEFCSNFMHISKKHPTDSMYVISCACLPQYN